MFYLFLKQKIHKFKNILSNYITKQINFQDVTIDFESRIKSIDRIKQKINKKKIPFDIFGLRIIYNDTKLLNNTHIAYQIKDLFYKKFLHIDFLADDYIENPKSNNYQSLHIYIIIYLFIIEIQIRNQEMHYIATNGTASIYH
jgi:guanosine-3',5'-bis(diphosphate) 3'-pyrophosphohydrolase